MLPVAHRLTKVRDFNLLAAHGRSVRGRFLSLRLLDLPRHQAIFPPRENPAKFERQLKIAVAAGSKVSKSAARRNRLKRQLREVIHQLLVAKQLWPGHYLLVSVFSAALGKNFAELREETVRLLKQAGALRSGRQA